MAKKGKNEYMEYERELFALRWEFIRRSAKYRRDVKKWLADARKVRRKDSEEWYDLQLVRQMTFMARYGIADILDPEFSFLESRIPLSIRGRESSSRKAPRRAVVVKSSRHIIDFSDLRDLYGGAYCMTPDRHVVSVHRDGSADTAPLTSEEVQKTKEITVMIVLDVRLERIVHDVRQIVTRWKSIRDAVGPRPRPRARLAQYKRYLEVFDLKEKGVSWDSIARRVHRNDVARGELNLARQRARRDYKMCRALIEGGHMQIR